MGAPIEKEIPAWGISSRLDAHGIPSMDVRVVGGRSPKSSVAQTVQVRQRVDFSGAEGEQLQENPRAGGEPEEPTQDPRHQDHLSDGGTDVRKDQLRDLQGPPPPPPPRSPEEESRPRMRVAFAVFITEVPDSTWRDALAVLAFGIRQAAKRSRHDVELIALSPDGLSAESEAALATAGFTKVLRRPVPVKAAEIQGANARHEMEKVQGNANIPHFALEAEQVKYYGLTLLEYDRVLVLDADTMILDPMDELMEQQTGRDFVGTYDFGLNVPGSLVPPVQGGFLLFKPSQEDFSEILNITREGDFRPNDGWRGSGVGYSYGGVGPTGLLSYFFHKDALQKALAEAQGEEEVVQVLEGAKAIASAKSGVAKFAPRMLAVDRKVYDVVVAPPLQKDLEGADQLAAKQAVKSVHFTGDCLKPWLCLPTRDWLCEAVTDRWWELRAGLEAERGQAKTARCPDQQYQLMLDSDRVGGDV